MILFFFAEAIKSILRAKASFILTVISLSISTLLFLSSVVALQSSNYLEKRIKETVKINLFLKETVKEKELSGIKDKLIEKNYLSGITYLSKEDAAELFLQETGEDFRDILDYNPLPASFIVTVSEDYSHQDSLESILADLSAIEGADEVVFKNRFVYRVLNFLNSIKLYLLVATVVVILIALYLVYTTIKLIIKSKGKEFETMKLVGAKLSAIKVPVLLNGLIAGILASIICISAFYFIIGYFESFNAINNLLVASRLYHLVILILTGPVLGSVVTLMTLSNISLKI